MDLNTKLLKDRLICFLDILGFSNFLKNSTLNQVHEKYSNFIDIAKKKTFYSTEGDNIGRTNFEYCEFVSDSIILVSNKINDIYNVNNFIGAINYLLETGFISNLPLRGAISRGDFLVDNERNIFLSKELAEVVKFESIQEFAGCSILSNAESIIIESIFGENMIEKLKIKGNEMVIRNNVVHYYSVQLKENKSIDLFVLNYLFFLTENQISNGIDYFIEPKKGNVESYFQYILNMPMEYQKLDDTFLPATRLKIMKTRSGMKMQFYNDNGIPQNLENKKIEFRMEGRWY